MDWTLQASDWVFDSYIGLFRGAPRWASLLPLTVFASITMLWVFGRTSRPAKIRAAKQHVMAHLLEMRLFGDDPVLVLRAQWALLKSNARYLGWLLIPVICASVILGPLFGQMERFYSHRTLHTGESTVFTVQLRGDVEWTGAAPRLESSAGLSVETPSVRVGPERQVLWRIRATAPGSGVLRAILPGGSLEKKIEMGPDSSRTVAPRRVSQWWSAWLNPGEARIEDPAIDWAGVEYPSDDIALFGWHMHWVVAFLLFSIPVVLLLKRRFGVTF